MANNDYTRDIENNYNLKIEQQKLRENFKNDLNNITRKYSPEFKQIEEKINLIKVANENASVVSEGSEGSEGSEDSALIDKYNKLLQNFYNCGKEDPDCTKQTYINKYNQEIIRLDDNNEIFQDFKTRAQNITNDK